MPDKSSDHPSGNGVRDRALQKQLTVRREKLRRAMSVQQQRTQLQQLLLEVDAALQRMETGTYGICATCHDDIENERLLADPLCRNCLDHLSPDEQRALERDLDLAFQVQSGLLPKSGPAAVGWTMAYHYRPVGPVSGDYCDLIRHDNGVSLFMVGDVMGKGVAASMLTTHLHAIFRSLGTTPQPVHELVAKANRVFCEGTLSSMFATLVCGRLGSDGAVEICNAGHCYPLHSHNGSIARVDSTGLPLGLFREAEYTSYHGQLAAGANLVVHTDGLSEAFNHAGDQYGTERLAKLLLQQRQLAPEPLLRVLLDDLGAFRSNSPITDDLTIMVIQRQS